MGVAIAYVCARSTADQLQDRPGSAAAGMSCPKWQPDAVPASAYEPAGSSPNIPAAGECQRHVVSEHRIILGEEWTWES
jgi:hypothetical protein